MVVINTNNDSVAYFSYQHTQEVHFILFVKRKLSLHDEIHYVTLEALCWSRHQIFTMGRARHRLTAKRVLITSLYPPEPSGLFCQPFLPPPPSTALLQRCPKCEVRRKVYYIACLNKDFF